MALSYDEPDALAAFAETYGITFPLLSDPDSSIIRSLGILNTLIADDDHPWFGIPFPGVYVTDGKGLVTAKFFESHLSLRPGVNQLVHAVQGETVILDEVAPVDDVKCDLVIDNTIVAPGIMRELVVTFNVPDGQHLYGEPVPEGMVATQVEVDNVDRLVVGDTSFPPMRALTLTGTGETVKIFEGDLTLRVPITINGRVTSRRMSQPEGQEPTEIVVSGQVRWQSCDDRHCHLPASAPFTFVLQVVELNQVNSPGQGATSMDSYQFIPKMVERRVT